MRRPIVGFVALGLVVVAFVLGVGVFGVGIRPAMTCGLSDPGPCQHTVDSIVFDRSNALYPSLDGRIVAVELRPAPAEWATSVDPGFQDAEWSALLKRDGAPAVLAACYYSSDEEVTCHTEERAFEPSPDVINPSPIPN
jgi:hypothetical protein